MGYWDMDYWDTRVWARERDALTRWHVENSCLREKHEDLLRDPAVRSRAAECRQLLVHEGSGERRPCGGAVHVAYIRLGAKGRWTRVGTVCRHCGAYTPDGPPEHEHEGLRLRPATPEEAEQWRSERRRT